MPNTHSHTPWRKSVLIPFWVFQLALELFLIAVFALAIELLVSNYDSTQSEVVAGVWLAVLVVCLAMTVAEIILLARHKLKPLTFVVMNTIKTTIWTILFVIDIISVVRYDNGRAASALSLIIEAVLLLFFVVPLIYGSVIYHRFRRDAKSYKPVDHPYSNPSANDFGAPTAYPSQYAAFVQQQHDVEALRQPQGARRLSYNHQKDTRFESYRRASNSYGDTSILETTMISNSPHVPNIHVEHHDGEVFEMESNRKLSR